MKKFTIKESDWCRGEAVYRLGEGSKLRRKTDGKMCCLGFYAIQIMGCTKEEITGKYYPYDIQKDGLEDPVLIRNIEDDRGARRTNTIDASELAYTNDDPTMTDDARKKQITKIFRGHDIEVEFVP